MTTTVKLTLSMVCPDANSAQQYTQNIQDAFAAMYPSLVQVPDLNPDGSQKKDDNGNLLFVSDVPGTVERQLAQHILDVLIGYQRVAAMQQAGDEAEQAVRTAFSTIVTTTDISTQ